MGKKVSIIVLNWNGRAYLKGCIESIKQNTDYAQYEVIVVDNGSSDGSAEEIKKMQKSGLVHKALFNNENKGFAFANNQGFAAASGGYFFMLNNDTTVTKGWLSNAVKAIEKDELIAAVGSRLIDLPDWGNAKFAEKDRDVLTTCGAAMLMRKSVIDKIGALDAEEFSPIYGEETDWCYRARNAGYRIVETDSSRIKHLGSRDTKRQTGREWQYVLLNTHRLKAMLFNLSALEFLRHAPGLCLIFLRSIPEGRLHLLLKSYWNNFKIMGRIMQKRMERRTVAKKIWGEMK
ncbi:MAG: glycosyltransferase family 2 protein [Candidatus Diapherotrites archaeon]|nr:glycosyltransferase family 2 protein [Candidatus Diapherotrites archaeon]